MVKVGRFASNLYDGIPAKTQTPNAPLPNAPLRMHRSERIPIYWVIFWNTNLMWRPHFSWVSIWSPSILMSVFVVIKMPAILIVASILNFFGFLVRCISSYFYDAKTTSWWRAQRKHSLCNCSRHLQFSSVL